jgi:sugar phosphate isomerase/epimerase
MHKSDMAGIIKAVAEAGYGGMVTGFFRLDVGEAENYKKCQREHNIAQAAIHIGGDFGDAESVKKQLENIPDLIRLAHKLECENIFLSGSPANAGADLISIAQRIGDLGKLLAENGLVLSYHNHNWEIKDDCRLLYALCDNTDPKHLSFVPDVGWVKMGGGDPAGVLKRLGRRVSNLHFKEFTSEGQFTELGKGIIDFRAVYEFAKGQPLRDFWIIAEQDQSLIGAKASISQNFDYIENLIKES